MRLGMESMVAPGNRGAMEVRRGSREVAWR